MNKEFFTIMSKKAYITNPKYEDNVILLGYKQSDSPYLTDIHIVVENTSTNKTYKINPKMNSGYDPTIFIGNFTNNNNILLSINSGGSGAFGYYYIYRFNGNNFETIFDFEKFNTLFNYSVDYQNNYQVKITNDTLQRSYYIDLKNKDKDYLDELYNNNGILKKPIQGWVSDLNTLYPIMMPSDKNFSLVALEKIAGLYNADNLGYIITILKYNNNSFTINKDNQYLVVN